MVFWCLACFAGHEVGLEEGCFAERELLIGETNLVGDVLFSVGDVLFSGVDFIRH